MTEEFDSSIAAWEYYKKIYAPKEWELLREFDLDKVMTYAQRRNMQERGNILRYLAYIRPQSALVPTFGAYHALGGDCVFNFKKSVFHSLVKGNKQVEEQLEQCVRKHHSRENTALMSVIGGTNVLKGLLYPEEGELKCADPYGKYVPAALDRPDTLLVCLERYYRDGDRLIFAKSTRANEECLEAFLKTFRDVYDYAEKVMLADRYLTKDMLDNGMKPIESLSSVKRYMELAQRYWDSKIERFAKAA